MSILKIARMGHPMLRRTVHGIGRREIATPTIQQLIDDMIVTMREYAGIGLAAPQVHHELRLLIAAEPVTGLDRAAGKPLVLINPEVTVIGTDKVEDWERCLSVPGVRGLVRRAREIVVTGLDREGSPVEVHAKDLAARVIQHEHDHLEGALFLDRMESLQSLAFTEHGNLAPLF